MVIESGAGITHCVPVFEALPLTHAVQRIPLGGQDVSASLASALREAGIMLEVIPRRYVTLVVRCYRS
jgi:actin-related protein